MTHAIRRIRLLACAGLVLLVASITLLNVTHPTVFAQLQTGLISGRVYAFTCESDVIPLTGATVSATLVQTGYTPLPTTTDSEGDYSLTLAPGEYNLFVYADFFRTQESYSFTIASGTVISQFNFYLYAATQTNCAPVQYQNHLYKLVIYSNSTPGHAALDSNLRQVNFALSVPNESVRKLLIVIPKGLLDGAPVVFMDNTEAMSTLVEGTNYFYVKFDPPVGSLQVMIRGSKSIPEFSGMAQFMLPILGFILTACSVAILQRRSRKRS